VTHPSQRAGQGAGGLGRPPQRRGRIPRVAGSSSRSRSASSRGSLTTVRLRPPPGARTRSASLSATGSSNSANALYTVGRDNPDARATSATPPRPNALAPTPWPQRPGPNALAPTPWPQRPGPNALAPTPWPQRPGPNGRRQPPLPLVQMRQQHRELPREYRLNIRHKYIIAPKSPCKGYFATTPSQRPSTHRAHGRVSSPPTACRQRHATLGCKSLTVGQQPGRIDLEKLEYLDRSGCIAWIG
jgi:hypothetical protein